MKITLFSAGFFAAAASTAFAADLPSPRPAPAPVFVAAHTWTGFYVGAQVGYKWAEDRFADPIVPYSGKVKADGGFAGAHVGYNLQFNSIVLGVEADANFDGMSGSALNDAGIAPGAVRGKTKVNWDASLRLRAGFAFDRTLIYATGGLALAQFRLGYEFPMPVGVTDSFTKTRAGWTVGAGVEHSFTTNWSARLEYRYADYGRATGSIVNCCAPPPNRQDHNLTDHSIRLGLTYRFAQPVAPVVAKY